MVKEEDISGPKSIINPAAPAAAFRLANLKPKLAHIETNREWGGEKLGYSFQSYVHFAMLCMLMGSEI